MTYRPVLGCAIAVLASGALGCSTHPLPQDISYARTVDVVRKVRCEAKDGLEVALKKAALESARSKREMEKIISTGTIGFEFKLIMAEDNKAAVSKLTFQRDSATPGDGFKLELVADASDGLGTESSRMRKNTRIFRVFDRLEKMQEARCGRVRETGPNLIHPITGSTGMAEVVRTYLELEVLTQLAPLSENETVIFSDKLDFTTTLEAGASANWEFSSKMGVLRLTNASLAGSALRKDFHSVTVALASDPGGAQKTAEGAPKSALTKEALVTGVHIPRCP